jgi:hypothetical protein
MFAGYLAFTLKIRVYWQKQFTILVLNRADIKGFFAGFAGASGIPLIL